MDYDRVKRVIDKAVKHDVELLGEGVLFRVTVERTKSGNANSGTIEQRVEGSVVNINETLLVPDGPVCYEIKAPVTGTFYWGHNRFAKLRNMRRGRVGSSVKVGQTLGYIIAFDYRRIPIISKHAGTIVKRVADKGYIAAKDDVLFGIELKTKGQ